MKHLPSTASYPFNEPPGKRSGFTLVELLVVIGIIAILVAVSFGGITAAIKSAQAAKCASNMRQIGIGFQSFLSDNNNKMPQRYYGDGTAYFTLLAPYTGNNTTDKSTSIFVCPTHTACSFPAEPSYGMNWYYDNTNLSAVSNLSATIMVAESLGSAGQGSNRADKDSGDPGELDSQRHSGTANYLFFDGHIERLKYADTTNYWGTDYGNHSQQSP